MKPVDKLLGMIPTGADQEPSGSRDMLQVSSAEVELPNAAFSYRIPEPPAPPSGAIAVPLIVKIQFCQTAETNQHTESSVYSDSFSLPNSGRRNLLEHLLLLLDLLPILHLLLCDGLGHTSFCPSMSTFRRAA